MAKTPRDPTAFVTALLDHYKIPGADLKARIDNFQATTAYQKAYSDTGGSGAEAAEILNRTKETNATIPVWFLRATRVQEFDQKQNEGKGGYVDKGPGIEVLLPNQRTWTYAYTGDTAGIQPLTPLKVANVTRRFKVYEKEEEFFDLQNGKLLMESHTTPPPPADPEWVFKDGSDGQDPGPIFKLDKRHQTIQGDTGDKPVFGIYTIHAPSGDDVRVTDGRYTEGRKKDMPYVQVTVVPPLGKRSYRTKLFNVAELARRYGLDETSKAQEWAEALDGKKIAGLGKIGALHPRKPTDFDGEAPNGGLGVFQSTVAELDAGGHIAKRAIEKGPNAGKFFQQLDLSKAPLDANGKQSLYANIGKFRVYRLEKNGDAEWKASVMATEVGGLPWLSLSPDSEPKADGSKKSNADYFCIFLDALPGQKKVVDTNNPFAQALQQQGLAKFT